MIAPAEPLQPAKAPAKPAAPQAAANQAVIFRLGKDVFALPVVQVREVLRLQPITPLPKAPAFVEGVISLRGRVMAVIDLRKQFGMAPAAPTAQTRIVIVRFSQTAVGLIVDGVEEVLNLPRETVQAAPAVVAAGPETRYLSGVARLGTRLILLLNLNGMFSPEQSKQLEQEPWQKS